MTRVYLLAGTLAGIGGGGGMTLLAAVAPGSGGFDPGSVTQLGLTGILAAALATFARGVYAREVRRGDELATELRELNKKITDEVAPTLARATDALAATLTHTGNR